MIGLKNINRVCLRSTATSGGDDMAKALINTNLSAGTVTRVPTVLTTPPYSIMLVDSTGEILNVPEVKAVVVFANGVYNVDIYSTDALTGINIFILY